MPKLQFRFVNVAGSCHTYLNIYLQQYISTKLSVAQQWSIHSSHRSRLLLKCSAAMDQWFQTDTARATTLSQTTSSSVCPVSVRAHRRVLQNLLSVWCRDCWTWGICAITAIPVLSWPSKDRVRLWRCTRKQKQTGKAKCSRDQLTCVRISNVCHRFWWRHQNILKWRIKPRFWRMQVYFHYFHSSKHRFWRMEVNHRKLCDFRCIPLESFIRYTHWYKMIQNVT